MIRSRCGAFALVSLLASAAAVRADGKIDFNRDIRPILSDKCFACHGPDTSKLKAKLRLDVRELAIKAGAIVAGKPAESEVVRRVHAVHPDEGMPPVKSDKTLTAGDKELVKKLVGVVGG